jgi:hypothetical protein
MSDSHTDQVREELKAAGMSRFGMMKFAAHYLPRVIHDDEHIRAVVNGRHKDDAIQGTNEAILVATDKRIIFLDHKPGYTSMDELAYDAVAGLNVSQAGFFAAITLYTRMVNYTVRFANKTCAHRFAEYVEKRRLAVGEDVVT